MRCLLAMLLLVLTGIEAAAQTVYFPSVAVGPVPAGPLISGWLYRPPGTGPFPAVVLAHACGGVDQHTDEWGRRLAGWGYVTLAPDSLTPRGQKSVCAFGGVVSGDMRVADVAGAMDYLNAQPFVRRDVIGLVGHSHGGWTAMRAVQKVYGLAARGLRAAVAYYPNCRSGDDRDVEVPLLILIGDKDDWTPAADCRQLQAEGFARPEFVDAVYYPGAYHGFDQEQRDRTVYGGGKVHHLAYDSRAAADAEARTRSFLAKCLNP